MSNDSQRSGRSRGNGEPLASSGQNYIPPLRFARLTSLYDPLVAWTARESTFKKRLVKEAGIQPGHSVLDLGCGTATLTILIKRRHRQAMVAGLDGDEWVLAIARRKVEKTSLDISLDFGLATDLPYPDESFDRVLSSLLFHHLTRDQKRQALAEALRVLRPGGELHIADWGQARNLIDRGSFLSVQLLDGFETTTDNVKGRLPKMIAEAGFGDVAEYVRYRTMYGVIALYRAAKPVRRG